MTPRLLDYAPAVRRAPSRLRRWLALCVTVGTLVLWVRSYWVGDKVSMVSRAGYGAEYRLMLGDGGISLGRIRWLGPPAVGDLSSRFSYEWRHPFNITRVNHGDTSFANRLGFGYFHWTGTWSGPQAIAWVIVPIWAVAAPLLFWHALVLFRWWQARATRAAIAG